MCGNKLSTAEDDSIWQGENLPVWLQTVFAKPCRDWPSRICRWSAGTCFWSSGCTAGCLQRLWWHPGSASSSSRRNPRSSRWWSGTRAHASTYSERCRTTCVRQCRQHSWFVSREGKKQTKRSHRSYNLPSCWAQCSPGLWWPGSSHPAASGASAGPPSWSSPTFCRGSDDRTPQPHSLGHLKHQEKKNYHSSASTKVPRCKHKRGSRRFQEKWDSSTLSGFETAFFTPPLV